MALAPILSRIAEKTGRYLETIAGAGFAMLFIFILLLSGLLQKETMMVSFFILGIASSYQILAIYKASTYLDEKFAGLATAITNMIIMSFGYFFHSSIGIIIKIFTDKGEAGSFLYGVTFIPIMLLIGVLGFSFLAYQEGKKA